MLTHKNVASNAVSSRSMFRMHVGDRLLSILPMAHTYECTLGLLAPIYQGACMYYIDKPPTATVLLPALLKVRPTVMLSVPLIMEKIYRNSVLPKLESKAIYAKPFFRKLLNRIAGKKLRKTFGGRLRFFGIGGAALAPDVEQFLKEARFPYAIGYGLTETSPLVAGTDARGTHLRAIGPALQGVDIRIAPPEGGAEDGEIQVRGPNVMAGYYKDPEKTAETFTADGWFRTGDTGKLDEKGRCYVRGRLKTMILGPSGENIYPEEIEALINKSNFVQESLVYGEPEGGLSALVMLKPEALERFSQDMKQFSGAVEDQARAIAESFESMEEKSKEMLESMRKEVNSRLAAFSRIGRVMLQSEPFEKTPTQKIKRHFYPGGKEKK
jgi:long-chain acyl-CoA synthetase